MEKVIMFKCDFCSEKFYEEKYCEEHEAKHVRTNKANQMLENGVTLGKINEELNLWPGDKFPTYLTNVTKDNCFKISYLQCCEHPAYRIVSINSDYDHSLALHGIGSWSGPYGHDFTIDSHSLKDPRPAEELFVDKRWNR